MNERKRGVPVTVNTIQNRIMGKLITNIGEPVFVRTPGVAGKFFDHIEVEVELNKELSDEEFRKAYKEAFLSSYNEVLEMINRYEGLEKCGIPMKRIKICDVMSAPKTRKLYFKLTIEDMKVKKVRLVVYNPADEKMSVRFTGSTMRVIPPGSDMLVAQEIRDAVEEELELLCLRMKDSNRKRDRVDWYTEVIDLCDPEINWASYKVNKEYTRMKDDTICIFAVQCCEGRIPETAVERILKINGRCTPTIICLISGDSAKKRAGKSADGAWGRVYEDAILELSRRVWKNGLLVIAGCAVDTKQKYMYEFGEEWTVKANKAHYRDFGRRVVRRIWEEIDVPRID